MPSKKKKYNARFPAGRIKKIMQSDEEIGKVAQAVPVIISRTLELFVESLLTKTLKITNSRNAKTLSTSHMKQCIMSEQRFDFLRELVKNIPDISLADETANYNEDDGQSSPDDAYPDSDTPYDLSMPSTSGRMPTNNRTSATAAAPNNGIGDVRHQPHFQYKQRTQQLQSQHQNGTNEAEVKQRLRQRGGANTSVITHTAFVNQAGGGGYVQPLRLMRSDSSPANTAQNLWHVAQPPTQLMPQKRLRHQSQSVPCSSGATGNNNNSTNNNHNNNNNCSPPKRARTEYTQTQHLQQTSQTQTQTQTQPQPQSQQQQQPPMQTAIPAPVFSYDLCNKPIVKIDYSNLPLTPATATTTNESTSSACNLPLSAPVTSTGFDFNAAAPIINIDLSNIVTNMAAAAAAATATTAASNTPPAVATISIGAIPTAPPPSGKLSLSTGTSSSVDYASSTISSTIPPSNPTADSKAKTAFDAPITPIAVIVKAPTAALANTPSVLCKNPNLFFELDEDYDNI